MYIEKDRSDSPVLPVFSYEYIVRPVGFQHSAKKSIDLQIMILFREMHGHISVLGNQEEEMISVGGEGGMQEREEDTLLL